RYAHAVDGVMHHQGVLIKAYHARRSWLGDADRSEPLRPVEPGISSAISVEVEQDVAGEVFGLLQWTRRIGCQCRTANRLQALAKQPVRIARCERLRAIAHGEVDALPIEIEHPIVGGDKNVDIG